MPGVVDVEGGLVCYSLRVTKSWTQFKRQSLTGKIFPDFKDKASMDPIQKTYSCCLGLLFVQPRDCLLRG